MDRWLVGCMKMDRCYPDFTIYVKNIQNNQNFLILNTSVGVGNRFNYRTSLHLFVRNPNPSIIFYDQ